MLNRVGLRASKIWATGWVFGGLTLAGCIPPGTNSDVISGGASGQVFPNVVGINLEGDEMALPDGFEGSYSLVAIAFEQNQQKLVNTWIAEADQLAERHAGLRFYEVPTIYEANAMFRLWVNNGMRSGIPDPVARRRTVTLYVDREEFIRELAIPDLSDIHVLLLDGEGQVLWRAEGPASDESLASLSSVLETSSRMTSCCSTDRRSDPRL